ncbi:MAG: hypothetical protein Q9219_002468 [cf. Caloplaca sp. 3 TL-2023]
MSHPRIEEVSDTDSDPSIDDPTTYAPSLIRPSQIPSPTSSSRQPPAEYLRPQFQQPYTTTKDASAHKHYQCIYPLYFDASRTRAQGRRVGKELAVANPLARTIVDAVAELGLRTVFEPSKMHPRDWGNPGRVRVLLKEGEGEGSGGFGRRGGSRVKNIPPLPPYNPFHPAPAPHPRRPDAEREGRPAAAARGAERMEAEFDLAVA